MSIELTTVLIGEEEPMQPVGIDDHGTHRFLDNRIVRELLDRSANAGYSLNEIAVDAHRGKYSEAEQRQLAQLIGYSVGGYCDLSYVNDESAIRACERSDQLDEDSNES